MNDSVTGLAGIEYQREREINFLSSCRKYVQLLEEQSGKRAWQVRITFFNNDVIHTVKSIRTNFEKYESFGMPYLSDLLSKIYSLILMKIYIYMNNLIKRM